MKKIIGLLLFVSVNTWAQDSDTLRTIFLSEVMIRSNLQEEDSLQNFFRANKSATTEDILSRLQGVYLIRRGSFGQEPMIRGMAGGQINLTIDGMKMFGACTDKMDPVSIYVEPQNLRSIDVSAGSNGSRLGSTVGGTVNMKLAEPQFSASHFSGKAGVGFQSAASALNSFINLNYSHGKSAYYTSLNYRKASDYRAGGGEIIQYSQYNKLNFSAAGKWQVGRDTLQANILLDDGWDIGFPALPMDVGFAKARIVSVVLNRHRAHEMIEHLTTKVYYNTIRHSMDDSQRQDVVMHMDMPGFSSTAGFFAEGEFHKIRKHSLSFRTDFYYNDVLAEMTMYPSDEQPMYMQTWPSSGRAVLGFYLNDRITINPKTKISINGRVDAVQSLLKEGFGIDQLEVFYPDVSSVYSKAMKSFNLKVNRLIGNSLIADFGIGYGERVPTLGEMFGFYLFNRMDGYDYVGDPDLKRESNWSGELTLNYYRNKFQLSVSGFYNYMPDYIYSTIQSELSPMTPGANGVKIYSNISHATVMGGEASLFYNITRSLQVITAWKYTRGQDFESRPLPMMPPLQANTSIRYGLSKFSLQLENETALQQDRINPSFGEDYSPGYSIMNFRASYATYLMDKRIDLTAGAENIFDKNYHNHLDWGNISRPGRNITASLTFSF
jgi:iron complex outermembrane recepter protein